MKRILLSLLLLVGMTTTGLAQTQIIMGDMNRDGEITISDVTSLVNVLLGKSPMQYITRDDFGAPVSGVSLDQTSLTLAVGGTATIVPSDAAEKGVTWTSSNPSVVSVSSAASSSAGGYEIILESFGSEKVAVIKVVKEMTGLGLVEAKTLVESAPVSLGTYDSATAATHQAALEEAGATVTLNALGGRTEGEVTAHAIGTATITATTIDGGYTATCTVTVGASHEYVDMGNGQLWATCNIGADSPEEYGDYFAWGETTTKTSYSWSNYAWGSSETLLTKYVTDSSYGTVDGKTMLEAGDDAATANWGNDWRTPTQYECEWLHNNCDWQWTNDYNGTGVKGYIVTSNITSNSIFFPAAGTTEGDVGSYGYYWSSTLVEDNSSWAINMFLHTQTMILGTSAESRYKGLTVRPVCSPRVAVSGIELSASSLVLEMGQTFFPYITATVLPENAFNKIITWTCSDENVVNFVQTAYNYGYLVPKGLGTATITATTEDGGYTVTCKVYVVDENHAYVEMGDGLKWATMNVGANSPEEYGGYFAWGETEPKTDYSWATYKHMYPNMTDGKGINKYQADDGQTSAMWYYDGTFTGDGKTSFEDYAYEDDAARKNWGGYWRTPTREEWDNLLDTNKFIWSYTDNYNGTGVSGTVVTSRIPGYVGNQIFFPAAGRSEGTTLSYPGVRGCYWTSEINATYSFCAIYTDIQGSSMSPQQTYRNNGLSVRAVAK